MKSNNPFLHIIILIFVHFLSRQNIWSPGSAALCSVGFLDKSFQFGVNFKHIAYSKLKWFWKVWQISRNLVNHQLQTYSKLKWFWKVWQSFRNLWVSRISLVVGIPSSSLLISRKVVQKSVSEDKINPLWLCRLCVDFDQWFLANHVFCMYF